ETVMMMMKTARKMLIKMKMVGRRTWKTQAMKQALIHSPKAHFRPLSPHSLFMIIISHTTTFVEVLLALKNLPHLPLNLKHKMNAIVVVNLFIAAYNGYK
nr:ORF [Betapolyomavirus macacae]